PDEIPFEQAAAMMLQGMTVRMLLRGVHAVQPGETILVHAAAGGVGLIMCHGAKAIGEMVVGTVSTEGNAETALLPGCGPPMGYAREAPSLLAARPSTPWRGSSSR